MTNTLGYYNPVFYATEALIYLKKALGMALSVNRSYEVERGSFNQGEYVNIKSPSPMTVNDAPATAQSLATGSTQIQLAYWREVKFKLTDKELAFTGERIIQDHILPAAYELAADVDTKLAAQYKNIPWVYALNSTPGAVVSDITGPKRILFDNKVPMIEQNLFYMIDGELQMGFQGLANFTQWQGSGPQGVASQMSGIIGPRYGVNVFANQNVQAHTKGTHAVSSGTFELVGAHSAGATTIAADATGVTGTLVAGDTFVIEGGTQRYTVTATATASGNAYASISIFPALVQNYSDNADITVTLNTTTAENLMYHRDAFALVMAPLPAQMVREAMGAKVETITDPDTGISIRARTYYMPDVSEVNVALDVLYGVKTLNPNLAVRAYAT